MFAPNVVLFMAVVVTLFGATAIDDTPAKPEAVQGYFGAMPPDEMTAFGCRRWEYTEELVSLTVQGKQPEFFRRFGELEKIKNQNGQRFCEQVVLDRTDALTVVKRYPLAMIADNILALVAIAHLRRQDGSELYVELIRFLDYGQEI